jgi:hypothetical protein
MKAGRTTAIAISQGLTPGSTFWADVSCSSGIQSRNDETQHIGLEFPAIIRAGSPFGEAKHTRHRHIKHFNALNKKLRIGRE